MLLVMSMARPTKPFRSATSAISPIAKLLHCVRSAITERISSGRRARIIKQMHGSLSTITNEAYGIRHARDDTAQDPQPYISGASSSNASPIATAYASAPRVADKAVAAARAHAKEACTAADIANDAVFATQRVLVAAQAARNAVAANYSNMAPS